MKPLALAAAGTALLAAGLTSCGSSSSDVAQQFAKQGVAKVEQQAFAATKGLTSVHVSGQARSATDTLALDLSLDRDQNCLGSLTVNGQRMEVRRVQGTLYLKASLATWAKVTTMSGSRLQQLDGKWVTGLAAADVSVYERLCDVGNLLGAYPTQAGKDDRVTGTAVSGGHPIVTVRGHFGGTSQPVTVNVLATKPHYITRLSGGGADLALTGFEKPVRATAPADADVVHISEQDTTTGQ